MNFTKSTRSLSLRAKQEVVSFLLSYGSVTERNGPYALTKAAKEWHYVSLLSSIVVSALPATFSSFDYSFTVQHTFFDLHDSGRYVYVFAIDVAVASPIFTSSLRGRGADTYASFTESVQHIFRYEA